MQATKPLNENEITINQAAIRDAKVISAGKSVLAGFLGGDDYSDDDAPVEQEVVAQEDYEDGFAGIGYVKRADETISSPGNRQMNAATEKLRKQMLGKKAAVSAGRNGMQQLSASKPRPRPAKREEESDDEEGGRSGVGKRKEKPLPEQLEPSTEGAATGDKEDRGIAPPTIVASSSVPAKKRGSSYLDQVLAERAAKRKKKRKPVD